VDDPAGLDSSGEQVILTIDARALLDPPRPFTDDELTELIAAVVDDLDGRVIDPSVSTYRSDSGVQVEVSMTIDTDDPWEAQAIALAAMRDAFDSAVPAAAQHHARAGAPGGIDGRGHHLLTLCVAERPLLGTIWGPHAVHETEQSAGRGMQC
jgi:hypothetical protein